GQMERAFELMCSYALEREAFGSRLADKQTVQNWIADSAAEIQACRLLTLDAAHKIDQGGEARVEVSLIKFFAARVLHDVIDRAIQVHGARGLTDETPLGAMYAAARAARIYDGPGEVMAGPAAGVVVESNDPRCVQGDLVVGQLGWQEYAVARGRALRKVPEGVPLPMTLHVLGTNGLTAYFGLFDVARPRPGDTVV